MLNTGKATEDNRLQEDNLSDRGETVITAVFLVAFD